MIVQKTTNHVVGLWHHMAPIFKPGLLMPLLLQVTVRSLCHSRGVTADYLKFQERFQMKKALVCSVGGRWENRPLGVVLLSGPHLQPPSVCWSHTHDMKIP
jgi:hypothetical protein